MNSRPLTLACAAAALAGTALAADPAFAASDLGDRRLRMHSHGADVRELQADLTRLGVRTDADGAFGRGTRRSVRRYERAHHITVDGKVSRTQGRGIARRADAREPQQIAPAAETDGPVTLLADDGRTALAPASAPQEVKDAVAAANRIVGRPYVYGGGHGDFDDSGYDCSGAVSYVLHGAGLLRRTRASGDLMSWGRKGRGDWITVYANGGHAYVVVAGLRFDTSGKGARGPRWRPEARSGRGYAVRHAPGL